MYTHFAYVSFEDIVTYLAAGWHITNELHDCHHGHYGVLMAIETKEEEVAIPTLSNINSNYDDLRNSNSSGNN